MNEEPKIPAASQDPAEVAKGFVGSLFDFSFDHFITPKIIKIVYGLALFGVAVSTLGWIFGGSGVTSTIGRLVTAPIIAILGVVVARLYVELIMLAFKILEALKRIEVNQKSNNPLP